MSATAMVAATPPSPSYLGNDIALIDLLDRLLYGGVVIQGDVVLSVADIDLVKLDLRILIASIDKVRGAA